MDKPTTDKWKAPAWMKPGVKVRIFKGRVWPIGVTGTVESLSSTGNGMKAYIKPDAQSQHLVPHITAANGPGYDTLDVWVTNLEKA